MRIRHVVAAADIDQATGLVTRPERARHAVIVAGRLHDLSGPVDPLTHLNLDAPEHLLTSCVVAEWLVVGAAALRDGDGLRFAPVSPTNYRALGHVDQDERRAAWLVATRAARHARAGVGRG